GAMHTLLKLACTVGRLVVRRRSVRRVSWSGNRNPGGEARPWVYGTPPRSPLRARVLTPTIWRPVMTRTLLTRIATGTLGLALIALAATGASRTAHADGSPVITPTTPTTIGPAPTPTKPDLVVHFDKVQCASYQDGVPHILVNVRVI